MESIKQRRRPISTLTISSIAVVGLVSSVFAASPIASSIPFGLDVNGTASGNVTSQPLFGGIGEGGSNVSIDPQDSGVITLVPSAGISLNAGATGLPGDRFAGNANSNGTASAAYGNLKVLGLGLANGAQDIYRISLNTASFDGVAAFQDTLTITSPTLPVGSPVSIRLTLTLTGQQYDANGNTTVSGSLGATVESQGMFNAQPMLSFSTSTMESTPLFSKMLNETVNLLVGDSLQIGDVAECSATVSAVPLAPYFDFMNQISATTQIDVLTPNVTYTAASGTAYATTTAPEPASISLLGLVIPLMMRKRRR